MNRVAQHPIQAFLVALAAVGVLSVMDAVMKALVLPSGFTRPACGAPWPASYTVAGAALIVAGCVVASRRKDSDTAPAMEVAA